MSELLLRVGHLYPELMNVYGDRGNIICLVGRCRRRGIAVEVDNLTEDRELLPGFHDLLFMGGGQDREQKRVADDLRGSKAEALRRAVEDDTVVLAICGAYQLMGHYYRPAEGPDLPGAGVFDLVTVHKGAHVPRCIGNVVARWRDGLLVGFENHGGRTYLGAVSPLARVIIGHGNNSEDGTEGALYRRAFGTYLHGSLLPKNPAFADHLIALAVSHRYGPVALSPLDDSLEQRAHAAAIRRATTWPARLRRLRQRLRRNSSPGARTVRA